MMKDFESNLREFTRIKVGILFDDLGSKRGILTSPAISVTEEIFTFYLNHSGALPFVALSENRANDLLLEPMTRGIFKGEYSGFVSVEAREGISTGISAFDRATTIQILGERVPTPAQLVKPGHVFPIKTRPGGVLVNSELPEAALDLACLSGASDAALFMDLLSPEGDLLELKNITEIPALSAIPKFLLSDLIRYRLRHEKIIQRVTEAKLPTQLGGELRALLYRTSLSNDEHVALVKGTIDPEAPTYVRVQAENAFSDVFGGDAHSRSVIQGSLTVLDEVKHGVLLYLRKPLSPDTSQKNPHMMREYGIGAEILRDLQVKKVILLTNNPRAISGLENFDLEIVETREIPQPK